MPSFRDFELDETQVAPVIYVGQLQKTTDHGVVIPSLITAELERFLADFNRFMEVDWQPYYRLDAYFDEQSLTVLEVNAAFVDGWGTALNLARSAGIGVDADKLQFPKHFAYFESNYLPELTLFAQELENLESCPFQIHRNIPDILDDIYVYARLNSTRPIVLPHRGAWLDNKLNLALFSRQWHSELVKSPRHYFIDGDDWGDIPETTVLKFCDKGSLECQRARWSVSFGKPTGKAPFIKQCYAERKLLAQDFIAPTQKSGHNCQLVILAIGNQPITGYVQYSYNQIINDNSIHGPLLIEN